MNHIYEDMEEYVKEELDGFAEQIVEDYNALAEKIIKLSKKIEQLESKINVFSCSECNDPFVLKCDTCVHAKQGQQKQQDHDRKAVVQFKDETQK